MKELQLTVDQAGHHLARFLKQMAISGERIVLVEGGRPQAVIVSLDDYERIQENEAEIPAISWEQWLAENRQFGAELLAKRGGVPFDLDALWEEMKLLREERHDFLFDN